MNYFAPNTAAERYAKGRPDFHGYSMQHIQDFLKLNHPFDKVLDIACGTGLSTKALLKIARAVYGTDTSQAMLDHALQKDQIKYTLARAEKQPFDDNYFDLITVCSGVHWFEIDKFLLETHRLLKSQAWLILYDNFFIAEMDNHPEFKNWYEQVYCIKFPAPARNNQYDWTKEKLGTLKFDFVKEETFTNPVYFNKKELMLYLTTQSNIIAVVEKKETTYEEVETWLEKELSNFFIDPPMKQQINFGNWIKYLQKV